MNDLWIDPILHRPTKPERWSLRSMLSALSSSTSCSNVSKPEMVSGGDISHWQGEMDWNAYFDNGMRYVFIRAMINGEPDDQFDRNAKILTDQGRWFGCYGATGYPTLSNAIPYARKLASLVDGIGNLSIWWDSEMSGLLSPYEMAKYNSEVMGELSALLPNRILEIYTRQSFWDSSVSVGNWDKYPLAAARYNTNLSCPWSDGQFIFRDWDDWRYWQDSQWWDGKLFGAESTYIDHDYFNGNEEMFKKVYNLNDDIIVPPPEPECTPWKFVVMRNELNYRSEPVVADSTWRGRFLYGDIIEAQSMVNPRLGDFWLKFKMNGEEYYAALTYLGRQYCEPL